jgi:hypothetical protein
MKVMDRNPPSAEGSFSGFLTFFNDAQNLMR